MIKPYLVGAAGRAVRVDVAEALDAEHVHHLGQHRGIVDEAEERRSPVQQAIGPLGRLRLRGADGFHAAVRAVESVGEGLRVGVRGELGVDDRVARAQLLRVEGAADAQVLPQARVAASGSVPPPQGSLPQGRSSGGGAVQWGRSSGQWGRSSGPRGGAVGAEWGRSGSRGLVPHPLPGEEFEFGGVHLWR
eukprot:COSAG04_NODE_226_length_19492_cov_9.475790_6_plen_191_part_00